MVIESVGIDSLPDQQPEPFEPRAEAVAAQRRHRRRQVRSAVRPLRPLRVAPHADRAARDHALRQKVPAHLSRTGDSHLHLSLFIEHEIIKFCMYLQVNRLLNALKNCTASMTLSVRQEIASYFVPELETFVDLVNELGSYAFYQMIQKC